MFLLPCLCELFCFGWQGIRAQDGQMPAAVGELKQCSLWQRGVPKPCSAALAPGPPFSRCASNFVIFYYVFVGVVCICVYIFMFGVSTDHYPLYLSRQSLLLNLKLGKLGHLTNQLALGIPVSPPEY